MKPLLLILFFAANALAQGLMNDPGDLTTANLKQEGQLVTVQIVFGQPLRIFVVGREEAKLNYSDLHLTVRRLHPYPEKVFQLSQDGGNFVVQDAEGIKRSDEIEVKTKIKDETETFRFNINKPKP